jgi:hypothetical protein
MRRADGLIAVLSLSLSFASAAAASASTISGRAFEDPGRTGTYQPGDTPLPNQQIYVYDGSGSYVGEQYTASDGTYSFSGLADGSYTVQYADPSWWSLRDSWLPDTTGSVQPVIHMQLSGAAEADFGWRPIVRSTNLSAQISSYTGPNGLTVESYDDVLDARALYDTIMTGTVGGEAPYTTVRFDWGSNSTTTTSVSESGGTYTNFSAISNIAYDTWLDTGDDAVGHEYGHAWGSYYAYIVQQDPTLYSYLSARGLWGNPSLNTSDSWSQWELLADDYRQLLGPLHARSYPAMNGAIPAAAAVPGLGSFLANTFTEPPAPANTSAPSISGMADVGQTTSCSTGSWTGLPSFSYQWARDGSPIPGATGQNYTAAYADGGHALSCAVTATNTAGSATSASPSVTVVALGVANLVISPTPVKTSATASFTLPVPAAVTVQVLAASGGVVSTAMSSAPKPAGAVNVAWNRPKSLKTGTYTLRVTASAGGGSTTATRSFSLS